MKAFSEHFAPENKEKFDRYKYERDLAHFRLELLEHCLAGNENDFFDLATFFSNHKIDRAGSGERLVTQIRKEIEDLGWKTATSFGGTALFVYSSENPPPSCFPDEL